jgi:hypothetical protein
LLVLFAALAFVFGILQRLGAGVAQNAHFDTFLAVMILFGIVLVQGGPSRLTAAARLALLLVAVAPAAAKDIVHLPRRVAALRDLDRTDEEWRDGIRYLAARPGPVICERLTPCYWAGKPFTLDFFNYGQKIRLSGDSWHLRERIARREFSAIVIIHDKHYRNGDAALPDDFYKLVESRYRLERVLPDDLYLMVPSG